MPQEPEQQARLNIDALLTAAGWAVQDYARYNPNEARAIALREVPLSAGRCDYLLMVDRATVGIIEAKREGTRLSGVAEQSAFYAGQLPAFLQAKSNLRFFYESTGSETYFRDAADPDHRSRSVFAFHKPETLEEWTEQSDTLRTRLRKLPQIPLSPSTPAAEGRVEGAPATGRPTMRDCQIEAVTRLANRSRRTNRAP